MSVNERLLVNYTNALGTVLEFTDPTLGIKQIEEIDAPYMPPVTHTTQKVFETPGSLWQNSRFEEREVGVPIAVQADDLNTLRERMRALMSRLNPMLGDGQLAVRRSSDPSDSRMLRCRYSGGLEATQEMIDFGPGWWAGIALFRAFDPYWRDIVDREITVLPSGEVAIPFFPMFADSDDVGPHFGTSGAWDDFTISNTGDGFAYPTWHIHGPLESPVITNATSGQTIDLSGGPAGLVLPEGIDLIITTERGEPSVMLSDGTNAFEFLTAESVLWPLYTGPNLITVGAESASPQSYISLTWRQRYLSM